MADNKLYYGDNLHILRQYIPDESVDLIYLDPPFNSNQNYNVLFKEENGTASAAQVHAFTDTWKWNDTSEEALNDITENASPKLVELVNGFLSFLDRNQFTAYLVMMTQRLRELHRVLKTTGSLYLHCDPTASHYLKIILDQIFGNLNCFKNELTWHYKRWPAKCKRFQRMHDIILFYTREANNNHTFNPLMQQLSEGTLHRWKGYKSKVEYQDGVRLVTQMTKEESVGTPLDDVWDIPVINSQAKERLGYPTQKPEALLERIINVSSNEGDIVLDPFCGCGTTIVMSEKLKRRWIGIDITHLAIALMKSRLQDTFGDSVKYDVVGEPTDLSGAHALARQDRYQFQWWALSLVKARPVDQNQKKGADKGIDGIKYINITPGLKKPQTIKVVVQVKSGHVQVKDVREFKTVIENTKSEMGLFVTLEEPTAPMTQEALSSGYYKPSGIVGAISCPKVQILTIEELLNGKKVQYPMHDDVTFRRAGKVEDEEGENLEIDFTK